MKKHIFLLAALFGFLAANAQLQSKDSIVLNHAGNYSADSFRLRTAGARISLYSFCKPYNTGRAVYFRKDQDITFHRVTMHNLRVALADNPASMRQLRIGSTSFYLGIGLAATGLILTTAGIIATVNRNNDLSKAYEQASSQWYAQSRYNANTPMPALPHYGGSPLVYIGMASALSCMIPLFNVAKHTQKAVDIYNASR